MVKKSFREALWSGMIGSVIGLFHALLTPTFSDEMLDYFRYNLEREVVNIAIWQGIAFGLGVGFMLGFMLSLILSLLSRWLKKLWDKWE